jgi:hypothetical protein
VGGRGVIRRNSLRGKGSREDNVKRIESSVEGCYKEYREKDCEEWKENDV